MEKSKNKNKKVPKNRAEYLVILKECKNMRHVFVGWAEEGDLLRKLDFVVVDYF